MGRGFLPFSVPAVTPANLNSLRAISWPWMKLRGNIISRGPRHTWCFWKPRLSSLMSDLRKLKGEYTRHEFAISKKSVDFVHSKGDAIQFMRVFLTVVAKWLRIHQSAKLTFWNRIHMNGQICDVNKRRTNKTLGWQLKHLNTHEWITKQWNDRWQPINKALQYLREESTTNRQRIKKSFSSKECHISENNKTITCSTTKKQQYNETINHAINETNKNYYIHLQNMAFNDKPSNSNSATNNRTKSAVGADGECIFAWAIKHSRANKHRNSCN